MSTQHTQGVIRIISSYCDDFPNQTQNIMQMVRCAQISPDNTRKFARELQSELHRMAGSAHCLGFRVIAQRLTRLEERLARALLRKGRESIGAISDVIESIVEFVAEVPRPSPQDSRLIDSNLLDESLSLPAEEIPEDQAGLAHLRILLIDDDAHVLGVERETLLAIGAEEVEVANSGLEALNRLPEVQPDLLITDWHMGAISGPDLLNAIRNGSCGIDRNTPVIFFSHKRDRRSRMQMTMEGANYFLTKPVSPRVLGRAISRAVSGS